MIRKRIKKRRNPSEEEEFRERRLAGFIDLKFKLFDTFQEGNPVELVESMILYKQGNRCDDCDKDYYECECEKCKDCKFNRCLCFLNIKFRGYDTEDYTKKERDQVKELAYEFLLNILTEDVYNDGRKHIIIPNTEYKNLNNLKKEFLTKALQKDKIDLSRADLNKIDLSKLIYLKQIYPEQIYPEQIYLTQIYLEQIYHMWICLKQICFGRIYPEQIYPEQL